MTSTAVIRFASPSSEPSDYTSLPAEYVGDGYWAISGTASELVSVVQSAVDHEDANDWSIS